MASLNQVDIELQVRGEREVDSALKAVGRSVDNLSQKQISAAQAANRLAAQRQKETQELERLKGKYVQGYTAMQMYSKELNDLARARQAGIISAKQQAAEVERLNQTYRQGGSAAGGFADANHIASRGTNAVGMATQQAGYQIGDFVVQVQGGTNAFVAFGQQATQLVGVLPMLAKQFGMNVNRLIAVSAGLGIVIPLATALGAALMRMRKDADEATESVKDLDSELQSLDSTLRKWTRTKEAAAAGVTMEEAIAGKGIESAANDVEKARDELEKLQEAVQGEGRFSQTGVGLFLNYLGTQNAEEAIAEAEQKLIEAEERLSRISAMQRQKAREEAEAEMNNAWEEQKREQAMAEYESGQEALREREAWVEEGIVIFRDAQERMRNEEIAATEEALQRLFRNRTVMYSIRFADEETVMSQDVIQPPKAPPMPSYSELLGMGWTEKDIAAMGVKAPRSSGGGGGGSSTKSPQEKIDEYMRKLEEEAELKLRVIGLSEEQTRVQELLLEYERRGVDANHDRINSLAQMEEQLRLATEAEDRRQSLMQTVNDSIEEGLMSLITGASSVEDAFLGMIRSILEEIARQAIVEPIAKGITSFLFNANGNAFNGGRVVPFADGGVVSSPTAFPMRGNQTGLMGEAGPEAIMPLKRGKGGKLGVSVEGGKEQPVVVNQSFNFSANGDDSVKRIIAEQAPAIANLTQRQIMDQRRRGGALKGAFG